MKTVAIIYHSRQGHTQFIAQQIQIGVLSQKNIKVDLLSAEHLIKNPEILIQYDGLIWGSPTYLGGVSSKLKQLMDATGPLWKKQSFKGKLAAGFTVSSLPAGDKQSTLISLFTFCMQHGMLWIGNPILPEQHQGVPYSEAANRLGSWSGLMAQAEHGSSPDRFDEGDIKTAQLFGNNFAMTLNAYLGVSDYDSTKDFITLNCIRNDVIYNFRNYDFQSSRTSSKFLFIIDIRMGYCVDICFLKYVDLYSCSTETSQHRI